MVMLKSIDAGLLHIDKFSRPLTLGDLVSAYVSFEKIEESALRLQTATFEKLSQSVLAQSQNEMHQRFENEDLSHIHQKYADYIAPPAHNPLKPEQLYDKIQHESDLELIANALHRPLYEYCEIITQLSLASRLQITLNAIRAAKHIRRSVLPMYRRYAQKADAKLRNQLTPNIEKVQNWIDVCPDLHEFALDKQHATYFQNSYLFYPSRPARSQFLNLEIEPREFLFFEPYDGSIVASLVYKRKECLLQEVDFSRITGGEVTLQRFAQLARAYLGELDMTRSHHDVNLFDYAADKPVFGKLHMASVHQN
jgi:hypothetical protein